MRGRRALIPRTSLLDDLLARDVIRQIFTRQMRSQGDSES